MDSATSGADDNYVDDLGEILRKEYVWDPKARTLSLTLRGASAPTPDENNPVPSGEPVIESQPENCTVKEGDYAVFEVRASGEDLKYIWQRDESDFNPAMPDSSVLSESSWNWVDIKDGRGISGANSSKLTVLADLYAIKSGSYRCIITDKNGNSVTSDYASIIPITPGIKITAQPQDQVEKAGLFATLHVGAEGLDLKYQWQELVAEYKTDGEFGMTFEYRNVKDGNKYAGAKTNTLTLVVNPPPPVGIVPEGKMQKFICLITDRYRMTISSYPAEIKAYTEIRITEQPKNIVMTERIPAELTVKAEGDPQITYRWQFLWIGTWTDLPDDHPLKFSGVDTQTLTWNQTSGTMKFRCVISSPHSEPVISDEVSITYNLPPEDYQIRHPKNIRAKFFEDAYFDFDFIGLKVDSLDCTWQKKGRDGIWVDIPDSNSKKLEVYVCQETSGCWFRCTGVVNGHAFTTVSARLEGTLVYRRQNLTQRTITIKENGALHWIDINDYIIGEGLTYEWHGHRNRMPENLYIIEPEYTVYKYGSVVHVVRTEVYGSKLGISTTGRRGAFTRHTGGSGCCRDAMKFRFMFWILRRRRMHRYRIYVKS